MFVITALDVSGTEAFVCRMLKLLQGPGFYIHVVALAKESTLSARMPIVVVSLGYLDLTLSRPSPMRLWRANQALRAGDSVVIQCWTCHGNVATLPVSPCVNRPLVECLPGRSRSGQREATDPEYDQDGGEGLGPAR